MQVKLRSCPIAHSSLGDIRRGKEATTAAAHEAADLWRVFWQLMHEMGADRGQGQRSIVICNVKAHTNWSDVMEGRVSHFDFIGNSAADKAAKEALATATIEALAGAYNVAIATVVMWAKWTLENCTIWDPRCPQTEAAAEDILEGMESAQEGQDRMKRNTTTHELWSDGRGTRCRRCGRGSTDQREVSSFGADACKGSAEGKVLSSNTGNINYLWAAFRHTKVEMARQGFTLSRSTVIPPAAIDEERLRELPGEDRDIKVGAANTEGAQANEEGQDGGEDPSGHTPGLTQRRAGREQEGERRMVAGGELAVRGSQASKHNLRRIGGVLWCDKCGAYSTQRAGARLRGECLVHSMTRHRATRLGRLREGRHPITNKALV